MSVRKLRQPVNRATISTTVTMKLRQLVLQGIAKLDSSQGTSYQLVVKRRW